MKSSRSEANITPGFPGWLIGLWIVSLLVSACVRPSYDAGLNSGYCALQVTATLRQGPNVNHTLAGTIQVNLAPDGGFTGVLEPSEGLPLAVTGQLNGRSIHLLVEQKDGRRQILLGVMQSRWDQCNGTGGGAVVGPGPGDQGDWSGEWVRLSAATLQATPAGGAQPAVSDPESVFLRLGMAVAAMTLLLVFLWGYIYIRHLARKRRREVREAHQQSVRGGRRVTPEMWPGESRKPLVQYLALYEYGDDLFDVSFSIEPDGKFLGECGIAIAQSSGSGPKNVSALEVWLYDHEVVNTVSQLLLSEAGYRSSMDAGRGRMRPGEEIVLDTWRLRLRVHVEEVVYLESSQAAESVFQKALLKMAVWLR